MKSNKVNPVLVALIVLFAILAFYFYRQAVSLKDNSDQVAQNQIKELIDRVGKLIILPKDENPTVATVLDPDKLKNQPFFVNAKQGDKLLIYGNAKEAILYDPADNKIVNVAPLNIGK